MGVFDEILDAASGKTSSEPKTEVTEKDGEVKVRNSTTLIDHEAKEHDTAWSNTKVNVNTGKTSYDEGAHGPNYDH